MLIKACITNEQTHIVCHPNTVPSAEVKKESYLPEVWRVSAGASRTALDRAVAEPEWEAEAEMVCSLQKMACRQTCCFEYITKTP